jgi:hypothetical protein
MFTANVDCIACHRKGEESQTALHTTKYAEKAIGEAYTLPDTNRYIKEMARDWKRVDELKEKRRAARKAGWMHQTCIKLTSAVGTGVSIAAAASVSGIWKVMQQIGIFFAYMWMLV